MEWLKKIVSLKVPKDKAEELLALDLGTEFVKAMVFRNGEKTQSQIGESAFLGFASKKQPFGSFESGLEKNREQLFAVCQEVIREAETKAGAETKEMIISVSGSALRGAANTFYFNREEPDAKVDLLELKNIIQKAQWKIFDKIRKNLTEEIGLAETEVKLISGILMEVRIDDCKVLNPIGFCGKDLSFSIFNTYCLLDYWDDLKHLAKALNRKILMVALELHVLAQWLNYKDCVLIDFGGRGTDVALIRSGILEGVKSINIGGQSFTKQLMADLGLAETEAEEMKIKYSQGDVSSQAKRKITEFFKKDLRIWLKGLEMILSEFSAEKPLPSLIVLGGGSSLLPGVKRNLEAISWSGLPVNQPFKVVCLKNNDMIEALIDFSLNLKNKKNVCQTILDRAIHLIQM